MSLTAIIPWFRDRFDTLDFEEHSDGFNVDNIGAIDLDRVYHVQVPTVIGGPINHTDQSTQTNVSVQLFFKGGRTAVEARDASIYEVEQIVKECCNVKNRTSNGLLNVVFQRAEIDKVGPENENSILVTIDFEVTVLIGVEEN